MSSSEHTLTPPGGTPDRPSTRVGLTGGLVNMPEALPGAEAVPEHAPPEAPAT